MTSRILDARFELAGDVRGSPMGRVTRARDRIGGGDVAVRLLDGGADDEDLAERLTRAGELAPAGLVVLLGHGLAGDGVRYVALEWLDGTTLAEGTGLEMPTATALEVVIAVARTLAALHAAGIVHGGVSVDRVVLTEAGRTVLLEVVAVPAEDRTPAHDLRALATVIAAVVASDRLPAVATVIERLRVSPPGLDAAGTVDALVAVLDLTSPAAVRPETEADLSSAPASAAARADGPLRSTARYRLEHVIGQGGLGRVVLAHDRELDRPVAIKELLRKSPHGIARFCREAMVTARLQHPGIVPVHDAGRWPNGAPFYAMKLVEGQDLSRLIADAPDLGARLALLPKLIAVCEAMAYAHDQRIIHRDLKPSNVVVGEFGETLVVDWGLAKELDHADEHVTPDDATPSSDAGLTRAGDVLGTPAYMSPEQARGRPVDARTDVYALGAMLQHQLSGKLPAADLEIPDAPPELVAIARKAMAVDPADRYPTALELARELRRFEAGQLVAAHQYTAGQILRRFVRRHRAPLAVAATLVAAAILVGSYALVRIIRAEQVARTKSEIAVRERNRSEEALRAADAERDRLRVLQGETALATDPTAALDWLRMDAALPVDLHARAVKVATRATALGVAFVRHQLPDRVEVLASGGDAVVGLTGNGTVVRWDRSGVERERRELGSPGVALAVSPDGTARGVATADGKVRLWRGTELRVLETHGVVGRLTFVDGGDLALAVGGEVWRWSGTGEPVRHGVGQTVVAMAARGGEVVAATDDGFLARVGRDGVQWRRRADEVGVVDVAVAPDGTIVTAGERGALRRWRADDGGLIERVDVDATPSGLAVDRDLVIVLADSPAVYRWSPGGRVRTSPLPFHGGALCGACAWHVVSTGAELRLDRDGDAMVLRGHADRITTATAVGADGLVSADRTGAVRFWHLPPPTRVVATDATSAPVAAGDGWIVGLESGEIVMASPHGDRRVVGTLPGAATLVAASPDGDVVIAASRGHVGVWRDGTRRVDADTAEVYRVAISDDGDHASALLGDRGAVWSTRTGAEVANVANAGEFVVVAHGAAYTSLGDALHVVPLRGEAVPIDRQLAFSPMFAAPLDDGRVAIGSQTGDIVFVDERGASVGEARLGAALVSLSAHGRTVFGGGSDGVIYRGTQGAPRSTLIGGHDRWVHGVDVTDDGWIASWSRATAEVRIWRADGASRVIVTGEPVLGAAFDRRGHALVVSDRTGTTRLFGFRDQITAIPVGGLRTYVERHLR